PEIFNETISILKDIVLLAETKLGWKVNDAAEWARVDDEHEHRFFAQISISFNSIIRFCVAFNLYESCNDGLEDFLSARPPLMIGINSPAGIPYTPQCKNLQKLGLDAVAEAHDFFHSRPITLMDAFDIFPKLSNLRKHVFPPMDRAFKNLQPVHIGSADSDTPTVQASKSYTEKLDEFEKTFLDPKRTLNTLGQLVIGVRSYVNARNLQMFCARLDKLIDSTDVGEASLRAQPNIIARLCDAKRIRAELEVALQYQKAVNHLYKAEMIKLPEPEETKKVLLFAFDQDRVLPSFIVPMLPKFAELGFIAYNLADDPFVNPVVPIWPHTATLSPDFRDIIGDHDTAAELLNDWTIDLENGNLICDGVNYFQGLYERVGRVLKIFTIDWSLPSTIRYVNTWIKQMDRLIFVLKDVLAYCELTQTTVTLFSLQSHFAPYFAMKVFADAHPDHINHITISSSYEAWKTNVSGAPLSTVVLQNNTIFKEPTLPAFGLKQDFEAWFADVFQSKRDFYKAQALELVGVERAGSLTAETYELLEKIKSHQGKRKIFCALGKIPYDLAVPSQGGPGHSSMKDWLNHTVSLFRETDGILLVKPHPHEKNMAIANGGNEGFLDLIHEEMGENVIVLPHHGLSLQRLVGVVDVFLCWNGSSIAELGAQGAKIVAADDWAARNYPIDVLLPESRSDYGKMIVGEKDIEMHPDFQIKSTAYVNFLVEAPFAMRFPFATRSSTNIDFNNSKIHLSTLNSRDIRAFNDTYGWLIERSVRHC
ncbi:hypothetical protein, partial [Pseudorhodobacter sp.]|uniref:hypothetical protein n=1 Tax=Pseudorhodobacter sp. TaxID=1934400 RepID=UPI0026495375